MRSRLMLPLLIAASGLAPWEPPKVHFKKDPAPPPPPVPLAKAVEWSSTADSRPARKKEVAHIETRQARRAEARRLNKQARRK